MSTTEPTAPTLPNLWGKETVERKAGKAVPLVELCVTAEFSAVGLSRSLLPPCPGLSEELGIPQSKGYAGIRDSLSK